MTDWNRIVREHGPMVFGTAWRILGNAPDAEDVTQEVFLEAHRLQQTQPIKHWPAFLRRLTTFRAVDCLRKRRKLSYPMDRGSAVSLNGPEAVAMGKELAERLRTALTQLPEQEGAVFCLRYFEDLSNPQIAEALKIKTGAVATALSKARARLEHLLLDPAPTLPQMN